MIERRGKLPPKEEPEPQPSRRPVWQRSAPEIKEHIAETYVRPKVEAEKERRTPLTRTELIAQSIKREATTRVSPYKTTPEHFAKEKGFREAVGTYPKGTVFVPTKEGYKAKLPEDIQLRYTKSFLKHTEKMPPVIKEVTQFGFGGISTGLAIGKPFAQLVGKGREFEEFGTTGMYRMVTGVKIPSIPHKEYGVHFVSPLDVPFEPLGLAPKGTTEIMGRYPSFTLGGIAGEVSSVYLFSQAARPITKGVSIGTKTIVSKVPKVYVKLGQPLPKVASKVGRTPFAKHLYGWGAKGMKPGYTVVPKISEKVVRVGDVQARTVTHKLVKGKRVWLTPKEQAIKSIGRKTIDITFPRVETPMMITKKTPKVTSYTYAKWVKPPLAKKTGTVVLPQRVVDVAPKIPEVPTKIDWYKFTTGLKEGFQPGGKQIFLPEKQWHLVALGKKKIKTPILKSTKATASILREPSQLTYRPMLKTTKAGKRWWYKPATMMPKGVLSIATVSPVVYAVTRAGVGHPAVRDVGKTVLTRPLAVQTPITRMVGITDVMKPTTGITDILSSVSAQTSRVSPITKDVSVPVVKTATVFPYKTRHIPTYPVSPKFPLAFPPILSLGGRGRRFLDDELFGKKYKFRMFKLESPLKGIKL